VNIPNQYYYDFAYVTVDAYNGTEVGFMVGWLGLVWFSTYSTYRAAGYPNSYPYTGQLMYYTESSVCEKSTTYCNPACAGIGMNSSCTGCDGGPWIGVTDTGMQNLINSMNSYLDPTNHIMYGPYFGQDCVAAYWLAVDDR